MSLSATAPSELGAAAFEEPVAEQTAPTTIIARSVYDTFYSALARRSEHAARLARESPSLREAMRTAGLWVLEYCKAKAITVDDVLVTGSLSKEGVIILKISQRGDEE